MTDIVIPGVILTLAASRRAELVTDLQHRISLAQRSNNGVPALSNSSDTTWVAQRNMRQSAIDELESQVAAVMALEGTSLAERFCPVEVEGLKAIADQGNTPVPLDHAQIEARRQADWWNKNRMIAPKEIPTLVRIVNDPEPARAG
jgi:hypothetical protein